MKKHLFREDEIEHLKETMRYAMNPFDDLPISRRLLTRAHLLATQGPRYEKKYPGEDVSTKGNLRTLE